MGLVARPSCLDPLGRFGLDAFCFLWLPVHGPLYQVTTSIADPVVNPVVLYFLVHCVVYSDSVSIQRSL
eukprot:scaffold44_cov339-Pavlova_lutheri.AAC.15